MGVHGIAPRLLSALVLVPVVVALAYAGGIAFNLLVLAAAALMAYEWNGLCSGGAAATGAVVVGAVLGCVGIAAWGDAGVGLAVTLPAAALAFAVAWAVGVRRMWPAAGVVYIAVPCISVIWLRAAPAIGLETIIWLLAVVWATDIGAYFAGRGIGGPKLAPRISPNKTWAGLAGGVIAAAVVGVIAAAFVGVIAAQVLSLSGRTVLVLFSAVLGLVAQAGDLVESVVKRRFGAKDSGRLIPGHGGVLDRLDGLMTVAPAVAAVALVSGEGVLAWR